MITETKTDKPGNLYTIMIETHRTPDTIENRTTDTIEDTKSNLLGPANVTTRRLGRFLGEASSYPGTSILRSKEIMLDKAIDPKFDKKSIKDACIYRFPKLSLPRGKVNIINDKYGSKITRDRENADIGVISNKYLSSICELRWSRPNYTAQTLKKLFSNTKEGFNIKKVFTEEGLSFLNELTDKIGDNDMYIVQTSRYYMRSEFSKNKNVLNWVKQLDDKGGYSFYIKADHTEEFEWLINNPEKLCWDTSLCSLATEDSVALTQETYGNIDLMLQNKDDHNRTLALEIMANCNVDLSHTFLALLFFFYSESMKNTSNWNHVNVKTLRNRYGKYMMGSSYYQAYPFDSFIKYLIEDNALTEFATQIIAKKMFNDVLDRTFGIKADSVFTIDPTTIQLKEKFKKHITKENIREINEDLPF